MDGGYMRSSGLKLGFEACAGLCVCACLCVCTHRRVCLCVHVPVCIHTCLYMLLSTPVSVYMHCVHACPRPCVCARGSVYVCVPTCVCLGALLPVVQEFSIRLLLTQSEEFQPSRGPGLGSPGKTVLSGRDGNVSFYGSGSRPPPARPRTGTFLPLSQRGRNTPAAGPLPTCSGGGAAPS